jgi:pimeloyl-ACP methyl ester carboxylesterase
MPAFVPIRHLVLLPGMDGTGTLFSGLIENLPSGFEATIVSYPNASLTEIELQQIVRVSAPVSEPFVLVAESFSTLVAIRYAATAPENLLGLVICAGFVKSPVSSLLRRIALMCAPVLFKWKPPSFAIRKWLVGESASDLQVQSVIRAISSASPKVMESRLRMILNCDVAAELATLSIPVLYLQAGDDRLVAEAGVQSFMGIRPQTVLKTISGPHLLFQREPKKTADAISVFFEGIVS